MLVISYFPERLTVDQSIRHFQSYGRLYCLVIGLMRSWILYLVEIKILNHSTLSWFWNGECRTSFLVLGLVVRISKMVLRLSSYKSFYNITVFNKWNNPCTAQCAFLSLYRIDRVSVGNFGLEYNWNGN